MTYLDTTTSAEHHHEIVLDEPLGVRCAAEVRRTVIDLLAASDDHEIVLDLGECGLADTTGLGLVVELMRRARRQGRPLRLVGLDARSQRLMARIRWERAVLAAAV